MNLTLLQVNPFDTPGFFIFVIFAVACFISSLALGGGWIIQSYWMRSKAGKILDYANKNHLVLLIYFTSASISRIVPCKTHNGYLETLSRSKNAQKNYIPLLRSTYNPASESEVPNTNDDKEIIEFAKEREKLGEDLGKVEDQILKPSILEGTKCPVYFAYEGAAVAVSAEALLGLGLTCSDGKVKYKIPKKLKVEKGQIVPVNPDDKIEVKDETKSLGKRVIEWVYPVTPNLVKRYLTKLVDQATFNGAIKDAFIEGYNSKNIESGGYLKYVYLTGIALIIVGAVLCLFAAFL